MWGASLSPVRAVEIPACWMHSPARSEQGDGAAEEDEKTFGGSLFSNLGSPQRVRLALNPSVVGGHAHNTSHQIRQSQSIKRTHLGALSPPLPENQAESWVSCAYFLFCMPMQSYLTAQQMIAWSTNTGKTLPTLLSLEPLWPVNWMSKLPFGESPISNQAQP